LSYDTTADSLRQLLGTTDGISLPTDLAFSGSSLLIANSGKGEIIKLSDGIGSPTSANIRFVIGKDINFNEIQISSTA